VNTKSSGNVTKENLHVVWAQTMCEYQVGNVAKDNLVWAAWVGLYIYTYIKLEKRDVFYPTLIMPMQPRIPSVNLGCPVPVKGCKCSDATGQVSAPGTGTGVFKRLFQDVIE
jgi:hypothetical protein